MFCVAESVVVAAKRSQRMDRIGQWVCELRMSVLGGLHRRQSVFWPASWIWISLFADWQLFGAWETSRGRWPRRCPSWPENVRSGPGRKITGSASRSTWSYQCPLIELRLLPKGRFSAATNTNWATVLLQVGPGPPQIPQRFFLLLR